LPIKGLKTIGFALIIRLGPVHGRAAISLIEADSTAPLAPHTSIPPHPGKGGTDRLKRLYFNKLEEPTLKHQNEKGA
jgi:hypothetical protein